LEALYTWEVNVNYSNDFFTPPVPTSFYFYLGLIALMLGAVWYFIKMMESQCPKCGKAWRIEVSRTWLNDKVDPKPERQSTGSVDGNGNTIYTTVPVPYVTSEYLVDWECSGCGHHWQIQEKKTRRG
jgi:hypothetical protein